MQRFIFLFNITFCLLSASTAWAHGDSLQYLLPTDTIKLETGPYGEKIFIHQMERKQTLYSLARFYGLSVEELYYFNQGLKNQVVSPGIAIRVPIPNRAIRRYLEADLNPRDYTPVYYVVKKGDTMYRISKHFFRIPIDTLMQRNNLDKTEVKTGQLIRVGWMNIHGIPEEYRDFKGGPLARRNHAMKKLYLREAEGKREKDQQGVAVWQKNSQAESDLYVLHREAPINSVIAITNPMGDRTVYAKVVGKVPDTAYSNSVVVVVSPLTAKLLGARDPRFFVMIKYLK
ncbi:MAG: hypothetical protein DHS20C18_09830 [Saprospiraceae bacterium]|nr:MAG: hypothetical protein DHS20C18_09830 [Saprospiraceae bacterium]